MPPPQQQLVKQIMKTGAINMLFKNGKRIQEFDASTNASDFLLNFPRGAYTTMRTLHRHSIFQLKFHIHRLIYSTTKMIADELLDISQKSPNSEQLIENYLNIAKENHRIGAYPLSLMTSVDNCNNETHELFLEEAIRILSQDICEYYKSVDGMDEMEICTETCPTVPMDELKITLLLVWYHQISSSEDNSFENEVKISTTFDLYSHITKLGERPSKPVLVDILPGSRCHLGNAKDSIWITERNAMIDRKSKGSNEVIMCESDGIVREGLSSNFFIVDSSNRVVTAKEGILFGSVRGLLIPTKDQAENIMENTGTQNDSSDTVLKSDEYCEETPNLADILAWKEAFITSTSRLVLPIKTMNIAKECIDEILPREKSQEIKQSGRLQDCGTYYSFTFESTQFSENLNRLLISKMQTMSIKVVTSDSCH
ncbi:hypothetical protein FDP41_007938 [Naegleria fowleri]|uniref:Uncharacterized protein n=1 Tax=Naegleria fowleri TaxID=5763 RepID=A0A6A5C0Q7_NAEFO|nr:uncharacterized protein FDP41_007938 [Naegleria fowleri]KAF0984023.1 hypothetical protein FDP41_007938 [Naegleria fowleri]CAG4717685.1 unnamed protein product [Naegleria fowleri]